jgi:hypothetical protein
MEDHISDGALEKYSLGKLAESRVGEIEEHLRICDHCHAQRQEVEPLNFVHFTDDGLVYFEGHAIDDG